MHAYPSDDHRPSGPQATGSITAPLDVGQRRYSIACICQIYNEIRKGNLERFVKYVKPLVDYLIVWDDSSTDGSYEYMLKQTPYVLRSEKTDFADEMRIKQILLDQALRLKPDFIIYLDADEVFTANAKTRLQELCAHCVADQIDGLSFHKLNLWRSRSWRRLDSLYDEGWFVHLWRVAPDISYGKVKRGLHQPPYPETVRRIERVKDVQIIHYGFSTERLLAYKYLVYKSYGQTGYPLDRLIDETTLVLERVPKEFFPEGLWADDDPPRKLTLEEAVTYVKSYRDEVWRPKFSIVCLIYKSVEWAKFIQQQVCRYTDMSDKEFFFVANDASNSVLAYLRDNYVQHYVWNNTPEQKEEWYINNVYRAWNFGVKQAKGDFVVLINSDMGLTPRWFENLWKAYNGSNCVASRLVESGKLKSGKYGVERDFGRDFRSYGESDFLDYAQAISEDTVREGGLYMPLLIRKEHFESVAGYPEGNIMPEGDIFNPQIAREGEPCLSGDHVLMERLRSNGISHQTAFNSIVYHIQCGEMDSADAESYSTKPIVAICRDIKPIKAEGILMWDVLTRKLPASVSIDEPTLRQFTDGSGMVSKFFDAHFPGVKVVIQSSRLGPILDRKRCQIVFFDDDELSSVRLTGLLQGAQKRVASSVAAALQHQEYDFEIIPIASDPRTLVERWQQVIREALWEIAVQEARRGMSRGRFGTLGGVSSTLERFLLRIRNLGESVLSNRYVRWGFRKLKRAMLSQ